MDLWVSEPEGMSREELFVLLAAKDERIDALLVMVGELTAQVQALVLRLGQDSSTSSKHGFPARIVVPAVARPGPARDASPGNSREIRARHCGWSRTRTRGS